MMITRSCQRCGKESVFALCNECTRKQFKESDGIDSIMSKNNYMQPPNSLDQSLAYQKAKHGLMTGRYDGLFKSGMDYVLNSQSTPIENRYAFNRNSSRYKATNASSVYPGINSSATYPSNNSSYNINSGYNGSGYKGSISGTAKK